MLPALVNKFEICLRNTFDVILSNISSDDYPTKHERFEYTISNVESFLKTVSLFKDHESQELFLKLISLYIARGFFARSKTLKIFSLISKKDWDQLVFDAKKIQNLFVKEDYILDRIETWVLQGYSYKDICRVEVGDVVIDGGAYTGNTAFYFHSLAGPTGKIYSFEPSKKTFAMLSESIKIAGLSNIVPVHAALSRKEGTCSLLHDGRPGARVLSNDHKGSVPVLSIDEFFIDKLHSKVDFIKLDIEGAELDALEGAKRIIQKFTPKMAICIYHKCDDPVKIPELILSINPNYEFYFKHNSNSFWESVLFCKPSSNAATRPIETPCMKSLSSLANTFRGLHYTLRRLYAYNLFSQIELNFQAKFPIPLKFFHRDGNFFSYAPFSTNTRLHYELLLTDFALEVCIHFEEVKKHCPENIRIAILSFFEQLQKRFANSYIENSIRLGFAIRVKRDNNPDLVAQSASLLDELIIASLPKFHELALLSPDLTAFYLHTQ